MSDTVEPKVTYGYIFGKGYEVSGLTYDEARQAMADRIEECTADLARFVDGEWDPEFYDPYVPPNTPEVLRALLAEVESERDALQAKLDAVHALCDDPWIIPLGEDVNDGVPGVKVSDLRAILDGEETP